MAGRERKLPQTPKTENAVLGHLFRTCLISIASFLFISLLLVFAFITKVAVDGSGIFDMIKFVLTFGAGIYTGIYISQNYEVPRVDEPAKILDKIKEYADEHRKKNPAEELVHDVKKNVKKIID